MHTVLLILKLVILLYIVTDTHADILVEGDRENKDHYNLVLPLPACY